MPITTLVDDSLALTDEELLADDSFETDTLLDEAPDFVEDPLAVEDPVFVFEIAGFVDDVGGLVADFVLLGILMLEMIFVLLDNALLHFPYLG